jgi:hypothetical protein
MPFDAEGLDATELPRPGLQLPVALRSGRDRGGAQAPPEPIQRRGHVDVPMGLDADGDDPVKRCNRGLCHLLLLQAAVMQRRVRTADRTATGLLARLLSGHPALARRWRPMRFSGRSTIRQQGTDRPLVCGSGRPKHADTLAGGLRPANAGPGVFDGQPVVLVAPGLALVGGAVVCQHGGSVRRWPGRRARACRSRRRPESGARSRVPGRPAQRSPPALSRCFQRRCTIFRTIGRRVRRGERCGRLERSAMPAGPKSR